MMQSRQVTLPIHEAHTMDALPAILFERVRLILYTTWGSWWVALAPLAVIAVIGLSAEAGFALVSAALLVLVYLLFAHPVEWVLYYYGSTRSGGHDHGAGRVDGDPVDGARPAARCRDPRG